MITQTHRTPWIYCILFATSILFSSNLSAQKGNQDDYFCPDLDSDGLVGVSDLLLMLSVFGEDWDCTSIDTTDSLKAIIFIEAGADANCSGTNELDLCTFMLEENFQGTWFGFWISGVSSSFNSNDAAVYMDWPGWQNGTENNILGHILSNVPQSSGGTDFYGNFKNAYSFETVQIPSGSVQGQAYFSVWIPLELMDEGLSIMTSVLANFSSNPQCGSEVFTPFLSGVDVEYTGVNWPNATYRVFTTGLNAGLNLGSSGVYNSSYYYLKGGSN